MNREAYLRFCNLLFDDIEKAAKSDFKTCYNTLINVFSMFRSYVDKEVQNARTRS